MAATFLRKYGVPVSGTSVISIPLVKAGVTNFAVGADWTPAASDVVVSRDGGSWGNITNLPIARTAGNAAVFDFILTGVETQAAQTRVLISDAATKAIEDDYFIVEFFGNISGMHRIDYSTITQDSNGFLYSDIAAVSGTRIQSPSLPGLQKADISYINGSAINTNSAQIGVNLVQVSGNILPATVNAGFLPIDWGNIAGKTSMVDFPNTSLSGIQVYTGNTKQSGDSFVRIGAGGVNLTSIAASSVLGTVNATLSSFVGVSGINLSVQQSIADNMMQRDATNWQAAASGHTLGEVILQSTNSTVVGNVLEIKKTDGSLLDTKTLVTVGNAPAIRSVT